jgi:hydroxymethylglutaryl-CoA reductase (NADPH)
VDKPKVDRSAQLTSESVARRWDQLGASDAVREELADAHTLAHLSAFARNIENFIGTVKVPVGIAGPLRVNGAHARGDFYLPLATTEAALVASYSRGAQLITAAGGCTALVDAASVSRAPGFAFVDLAEANSFASWVRDQFDALRDVAAATTRHGRLASLRTTLEGNHVYVTFSFSTGEAAGQNMVTIATQAMCAFIAQRSPVKPQHHFLEANFSGDKKATVMSLLGERGRRAIAEVTLPRRLIEEWLHTTPRRLTEYWQMGAVGAVMSGSIGIEGHYANGLAALFIACGQDAACVAESAIGISRFTLTDGGDLYASVTLPNAIVGAVGGGTGLPSQRACLDILGLPAAHPSNAFAEICAGVCLAGELSISGALCAAEFASAHERLARGTPEPNAEPHA